MPTVAVEERIRETTSTAQEIEEMMATVATREREYRGKL